MAVGSDTIHDDAVAEILAGYKYGCTVRLSKWLNYTTGFAVFYSAATGVVISFLEHPVWPLGVAVGSAYSVLLLLLCLFGYLSFKRIIRGVDEFQEATVARLGVAVAGVLLVFLAAYVLDTLDRKYAAAGLLWAVNAATAAGVLIWWLFDARDCGGASAASYELASTEISPV